MSPTGPARPPRGTERPPCPLLPAPSPPRQPGTVLGPSFPGGSPASAGGSRPLPVPGIDPRGLPGVMVDVKDSPVEVPRFLPAGGQR